MSYTAPKMCLLYYLILTITATYIYDKMNSQIIYEGGSVTQLSDFIANKYEGVFNINDTMTLFQSPISLLMSVTSPSDSVKVLCSLRNVIITQSLLNNTVKGLWWVFSLPHCFGVTQIREITIAIKSLLEQK